MIQRKRNGIPLKWDLPSPWNTYYARARCQALYRNSFWAFTPHTWYHMWQQSGVMQHKGRKIHQYRMVRMDPIEAYGPHNCIIVSNRMAYRKNMYENLRRGPRTDWQTQHAVNHIRSTDEKN